MSYNQTRSAGHKGVLPRELLPEFLSSEIYADRVETSITPAIAHAHGDFEDALVAGSTVVWTYVDSGDGNILQTTQTNEEPEIYQPKICTKEARLCGSKQFDIKLADSDLRDLQNRQQDSMYFDLLNKQIGDELEQAWDESHLATMLLMASPENQGNNAQQGELNLGSPSNPIVIPIGNGRQAAADKLEEVFADLNLALINQNVMVNRSEDIALIMDNKTKGASRNIFRELNLCCGDDNVRVHGRMPETIYGMDSFHTGRKVMQYRSPGNPNVHYIIAANKEASGFVGEMFGFKWHETKFDNHLVGQVVFGSYVTLPKEIAVAAITYR